MQLDQPPGVGSIQESRSRRFSWKGSIRPGCLLLLAGVSCLLGGLFHPTLQASSRPGLPVTHEGTGPVGQFGSPLLDLGDYYRGPHDGGHGNHLFDMWRDQKLSLYVRASGLTNHQALIINSHGETFRQGGADQYSLYPHDSLLPPVSGRSDERHGLPRFGPMDFARYLGIAAVHDIRIILIGGCNTEGGLDLQAWRVAFPNATTIIHAPFGEPGYQPMLHQVLFSHSREIQDHYEVMTRDASGQPSFRITRHPVTGAKRMRPYVASLFHEGGNRPCHGQVAGRELFGAESWQSSFHAKRCHQGHLPMSERAGAEASRSGSVRVRQKN